MNEESQEQKKASRNYIDRANSAYNKYKNARKAFNIGKQFFGKGSFLGGSGAGGAAAGGTTAGGAAAAGGGAAAGGSAAAAGGGIAAGGWIVIVIVLIIIFIIICVVFIIILLSGGSGDGDLTTIQQPTIPGPNQPVPVIPGFTISKTGDPNFIDVNSEINFQIQYTYTGSATPLDQITIVDVIPENATYIRSTPPGIYNSSNNTVSWPLSDPQNQTTISITLKPTDPSDVTNRVVALTSSSRSPSGPIANILPPTVDTSPEIDAAQQDIANRVLNSPHLSDYQTAANETGLPWEILAALHWRESSLGNGSLVSGRPIGANEPDIVRAGGCSSTYARGRPVAEPGVGCVFRTFLDSAIYAANHFLAKNGDQPPASFEEMTYAFAGYNGWGNTNCGKTPYSYCPPSFKGDDHVYAMNKFDNKHGQMYIVYCADLTVCNPPVLDQRLGAVAVVLGLSRFGN